MHRSIVFLGFSEFHGRNDHWVLTGTWWGQLCAWHGLTSGLLSSPDGGLNCSDDFIIPYYQGNFIYMIVSVFVIL
jgi:hypothetical protein